MRATEIHEDLEFSCYVVMWKDVYGRRLPLMDEAGRSARVGDRREQRLKGFVGPENLLSKFARVDDVFRSLE